MHLITYFNKAKHISMKRHCLLFITNKHIISEILHLFGDKYIMASIDAFWSTNNLRNNKSFHLPVRMLWNAVSTLVESKAEVSINDN